MAGVVDAEFDRILRGRLLETVFQPIVRLGDGSTVAFEALVRGPKGSRFASAPALLAEAYRTRRVTDFDWVARASACRAAMAAGLSVDFPLFVNIEPLALDTECPADLREDIDTAYRRLHIVLEVTERSLDRDPASLLDGIARVRDAVGGLAVDDVGANAATLRMLAVLQPELIKLDPRLLACESSPDAARVLDYVYAESERTGAALLAEGVQNADQADVARSIGVQLAQGRLFGHPGPLPTSLPPPGEPLRVRPNPGPNIRTPFAAAEGRPLNRATAQLLTPLTRQPPSGENPAEPGILLVLLPDPQMLGAEEPARFREGATKGTLTGILGPDVEAYLGNPIRSGRWEPDDELKDQWAVISLNPHTARAFLARRAADDRSEFEFTVTHDRQRVIAAARSLLRRLEPPERGNDAPSNREIG